MAPVIQSPFSERFNTALQRHSSMRLWRAHGVGKIDSATSGGKRFGSAVPGIALKAQQGGGVQPHSKAFGPVSRTDGVDEFQLRKLAASFYSPLQVECGFRPPRAELLSQASLRSRASVMVPVSVRNLLNFRR